MEARGGDLDRFNHGRGGDARVVHGDGRGDDGDDFDWVGGWLWRSGGGEFEREDLLDREVLGFEDAVKAFEGEGPFAIEEVGDVGLLKSQMEQLMGIGQPGRIAQIEERVERHERSVQRIKGVFAAFGGLLTMIHLTMAYLRR